MSKFYTKEKFDHNENQLFKNMTPKDGFPSVYNVNVEQLVPYKEREEIKNLADKIGEMGFSDGYYMLKDISHWFRYLEQSDREPKDLFEYIEWKYSNSEGNDENGNPAGDDH